jgi:hypothetical protein
MKPEEILNSIAEAGSWLPITAVRWAFTEHEAVGPVVLEAVQKHAAFTDGRDIRNRRLATFGIFFLAQVRDRRLFEPLVRLFESTNPEADDEWLFSARLFFFGHRLLAGVCPHDPRRPLELALNPDLKPLTRAIAVCAIGLLGAYGDIHRAEAVRFLRQTFKPVRTLREDWTASCWSRTAAKLHCREFERELQWFLASGLLSFTCRQDIARALQGDPDAHLISVIALEPMVDLFSNVFPQEIRSGEIGLIPNGQIPGLELFRGSEPRTKEN